MWRTQGPPPNAKPQTTHRKPFTYLHQTFPQTNFQTITRDHPLQVDSCKERTSQGYSVRKTPRWRRSKRFSPKPKKLLSPPGSSLHQTRRPRAQKKCLEVFCVWRNRARKLRERPYRPSNGDNRHKPQAGEDEVAGSYGRRGGRSSGKRGRPETTLSTDFLDSLPQNGPNMYMISRFSILMWWNLGSLVTVSGFSARSVNRLMGNLRIPRFGSHRGRLGWVGGR